MTPEHPASVPARDLAGAAVPAPAAPTPTPPFDTFIFDLDGTLLDTLPDLVVLTNMALRAEGYPERSEAEILSYVGNGVRALMYQAVPEGTPADAAERAMSHWKELFSRYDNNLTRPYPGIEQLLDELTARGCKLAVLSNKFDAGVQEVMGKHLPGRFQVMHGECADIPRKPNPAGLLRTIAELNSTPERTVYVGDSPGDVRAAWNAGTYAIGVTWGYHKEGDFAAEDAAPDFMAHAPLDMLAVAIGEDAEGVARAEGAAGGESAARAGEGRR